MGEIIDRPSFGEKLSDSIIEFYKPKNIPVQLEVVFIHGLEHGNCGDTYWKTWLAQDGIPDNVWPRTWLPDEFPSARVLALSYDASIQQTATDGRMDLYSLGEKLVQEIVDFGGIGQNGVPVVFVCHGFGGLVAKQIVVSGKKPCFSQNSNVQKLLQKIDAFCFYSTPHHGSNLAKSASYLNQGWLNLHPILSKRGAKGPLIRNFEVFNTETGRLNQEFEQCKHPSWQFFVVAEALEIPKYGQMIVPEASSRYEIATYMALNANYLDICKPKSKKDSSYQWLSTRLREVLARNVVCLPAIVESLALESLVRLEEQEKCIKRMMQDFSIVGLIGMGGSGKTTLARVLFQSICKDFEGSSYLDDVKSKASLDEVLVMLLGQFGIRNSMIGGTLKQSDFEDSKQSYLKELKVFVKTHKVLVLVDDVGTEENFNCLLKDMDFTNAKKGSKMIVTCREWHWLRKRAPMVGKYEMVLMNRLGQDVELFSCHAFQGARTERKRREVLQGYLSKDASGTSIGEFESVCDNIVKACGGLPLSLEVMGSCLGGFLKDGDIPPMECLDLWRGALQKLTNAEALEGGAENERLWKSLRISYDVLCLNVKEKFLDVACFFCGSRRYDKHTLLRIWGGKPTDSMELQNLKERCLIKIDKEDGIVTMHDQLRDMGRGIVKDQGRGDVKHMTRIWEHKDVSKFLHNKEPTPILGLSLEEWRKMTKAPMRKETHETLRKMLFKVLRWDRFILNCPNLRLLDLHEVKHNIIAAMIIKDLSCMRWLCLGGGNITEVPKFVWSCIELCVLHLQNCTSLKKLSKSIGNLVNLLELDLRNCTCLRNLPKSIGNLVNLSRLNLEDCVQLTCLPESIGNLVNLSTLDLENCEQLTCLPESIGNLVNLSTLDLGNCEQLTCLPESIGNLVNLSTLHLRGCEQLTCLPESIGNLVNLSMLNLWGCKQLTCLPESIGNLVNLSRLNLEDCVQLTCLPESIGNLVNLSTLDLENCEQLTCLPESIGNLVNLSTLDLGNCEQLTCLPESIGNLVNLSTLHLRGCEQLTCLPESIGNLVNLSTLHLRGCKQLTCLPESIGNLVNLSRLNLEDCVQLTCLPESIGNLVNLSTLDLENCEQLTCLPESIGNLVNLSRLNLEDCVQLTCLPESIGNLVNLSTLHLRGCKQLTCLPESIGNLVNLSRLNLEDCVQLTCLPESIGNLVNLSTLDLENCEQLTCLPESIGNLVNLSTLDLGNCEQLTCLPESIGNLVNLSTLHLRGCEQLTCLPESIGNLVNLSTLHLRGCKQLTCLPESIGNLVNLSRLNLEDCVQLTCLPESIGNLVNLSMLNLWGCKQLTCLPESIGNLVNLSRLNLEDCVQLTCLPESIGNLVNLSTLELPGCEQLTCLPESIGNLVNLSRLNLWGCKQLTCLPESIGNLVNLSTLELPGCEQLTCLPESIGNLVNL